MNKIVGVCLALLVVFWAGLDARSADTQLTPPGISADNWIALGDRAGFVLTNGDMLNGSSGAVGVAKGYFMLRRAGVWLRLEPIPSGSGTGG